MGSRTGESTDTKKEEEKGGLLIKRSTHIGV